MIVAVLGIAVLVLLTANVILASAVIRRQRPLVPESRALPVVMLGSTIQALVAVSSASDVRRAIDYWSDRRDLVDVMAAQFREHQATHAGKIIDDSGRDLQSFIESLPEVTRGALSAQGPSLYGGRDYRPEQPHAMTTE